MKKDEFKKLAAYYGLVKSTKDQIEALEGLIQAIRTRDKGQNGAGSLRFSIHYDGERHLKDQGWWGRIPVYVCREAILPALYEALQELRAAYKAMPPIKTEEVLTK